jgi:hypothetical protein
MRVHRNPTVKVDADQNPITVDADQNPITVDADQTLITSVAETTGRVAAKVTNVLSTLAGVVRRGRKR